jgi:uncharacterized protein YkwD
MKAFIICIAFFTMPFAGSLKKGVLPKKIDSNKEATFTSDEADAKQSIPYLNQIRSNPSGFSAQLGVDLSAMKANKALTWNDTLAKVALAKAMDMAKRNYFAHVDPDGNGINIKIENGGYTLLPDWYSDRSKNYFESIGAGYDNCKDAIDKLIIDAGTPSLGHRLHLLGQGTFWNNCYDIGIGEVKVTTPNTATYTSYYSFVIAKHQF